MNLIRMVYNWSTPIYNYFGDAEIEQDFHDGWYWAYLPNEGDTGP